MNLDQDMQDVIDRLTERDDDIVLGPLNPVSLKMYLRRSNPFVVTRELMNGRTSKNIQQTIDDTNERGTPWGVLKPFTDADGKRWKPGDENGK